MSKKTSKLPYKCSYGVLGDLRRRLDIKMESFFNSPGIFLNNEHKDIFIL